jgi:hypothetical protein
MARERRNQAYIIPAETQGPSPKKQQDDFIPFATVRKIALVIALLCIVEVFMPQAYGKMGSEKTLFSVPPKIGWWLMEIPVTVVFGYLFWVKGQPNSEMPVPFVLGCILSGHYLCESCAVNNGHRETNMNQIAVGTIRIVCACIQTPSRDSAYSRLWVAGSSQSCTAI